MRRRERPAFGSIVLLLTLAGAAAGVHAAPAKDSARTELRYLRVEGTSRFLHQPDVGPASIVFVSGDDLWTVPAAGGRAKRLTSLAGRESSPRFSPDGRQVAFSGEANGNLDVFVISATGGEPRRLTHHPSDERVEGWSPDGTTILFSSDRESDQFLPRLHTVSVAGGHPAVFPMQKGFRAAFSPDGKRLAYTP